MWAPVAFLVLLGIAYWNTILITAQFLVNSDDMAHGLFAPVIAGWIVWTRRQWLCGAAASRATGFAGAAILLLAALTGLGAALGGSTTISRFALILSLTGGVVLMGGVPALKAFAFPISLLLFTFPLPQVLYGEITLPLQLLASRLSEGALELLGFSVFREGNILELGRHRLSVVEACSGIRSLITLTFFCVIYSCLMEPRKWLRVPVVIAAIPAAILMNTVRITTTGVLIKYDAQYTAGIYHDALAWVCLGLGFAAVYLFHKGLQHAFRRGAGTL